MVQKRSNAAVFSLNSFAIPVICCVRTQTLIPYMDAGRYTHEFTFPLLHISRSSTISENDQCICSLIHVADNLERIINLAWEWS